MCFKNFAVFSIKLFDSILWFLHIKVFLCKMWNHFHYRANKSYFLPLIYILFRVKKILIESALLIHSYERSDPLKSPGLWLSKVRSKFPSLETEVFCKKNGLKNFTNFTRKHRCWSLFLTNLQARWRVTLLKKTSAQVSSCKICEIFKNNYFEEHL